MLVRTGLSLLAVGAVAATAIAGTSLTGGTAPADLVQSDAPSGGGDGLDLRPRIAQADTTPAPTPIQTVPAASPAEPNPAQPAAAQPGTTPADATGAEAPAAPGDAQPQVDESALRYFARQGDLDRVEAEIRRLKTLYPNWQPPVDLLDPRAAGGSQRNELQPIWDLYGAGRYSEARQALAKLQASRQNWKPPADLVAALDQGEARQRLINASDNKQWNSVLEIATQNQSLLVCSNVDVLWRVAHAFLETGKTDRTRDVYAYILQNCTNPQERAATMQKAVADLPPDEANALMRYARTNADGRPEFSSARLSLLRAQIGLASKDPSVAVTPDDLAALAAAAAAAKTPDDPILLGFYYYSHKDPTQAIQWFKTALDRKGGAKAAEGYILSLRAAGNDLAAVPAAYEWRTAGTSNMALYLSLVGGLISAPKAPGIDQTVVSQYAPVVLQTKSAYGALSLGWYAANHAQPAAAAEWFQTSLDYEPSEAAAYGLGLAMRALKNEAGLQAVVARWTPNFPRLPQLLRGQAGGPPPRPDPQVRAARPPRRLR
ncbi:hypothetical protein [Segnochrobactrum spirostomi]|uniref:Cellulose synthase n=1 Tax=Segnochrobactrum spirostomi TaxID=2608987 RepID=A0A6A7Y7T2_9HYPH|nr:hypothetical protein [Segnochrobactrum spirostomi]MQT13712.1 hypothetical protein [Segnochrobactrum spirostomi]